MKYYLFISYNCGCDYQQYGESENPKDLLEKVKDMELDKQMLRWSIENEKGDFYDISPIHKQIILTMEKANKT